MRKLGTWREYLIERFADRDKAIRSLQIALEEYQNDGDARLLLLALRTIVEAQGGASELAKKIHTEPQHLLKILSSDEPPTLKTLSTLLKALGWQLSIAPLKHENTLLSLELTAEDENTRLGNVQYQLTESGSS